MKTMKWKYGDIIPILSDQGPEVCKSCIERQTEADDVRERPGRFIKNAAAGSLPSTIVIGNSQTLEKNVDKKM
jgi:hypothetical protein